MLHNRSFFSVVNEAISARSASGWKSNAAARKIRVQDGERGRSQRNGE